MPDLAERKRLPLIVAAFAILLPSGDSAAEEPWLPHRENDVELSVALSTIAIRTTGHDPFLVWLLPEIDRSQQPRTRIRVLLHRED